MKVLTVLGARPQFIKAAPLSRLLRQNHTEFLVHTGQHYDEKLSSRFFDEFNIPNPDVNLEVGSGLHGEQTGAMLAGIERTILAFGPDIVLVYGDTNSTLAGALAAAKLCIPLAHVEAGLRSFNRSMPEEVNRVLTDHLSTWLFAPSRGAARQLELEGITSGIHVVGDIMLDTLRLTTAHDKDNDSGVLLNNLRLTRGAYHLCTVHRAENTDSRVRLSGILEGLSNLSLPVVLPLHPRTRISLQRHGLSLPPNAVAIDPLGHKDMMCLVQSAKGVLTDSGGLQKESYYLGVPCVTLRDETEWVETLATGWNRLAGADPDRIREAIKATPGPTHPHPTLYGDGHTAVRIASILSQWEA